MNLETDNPEKGQLLQRSAHHRELLEEEMKAITEKSERILTNAIVIGGALALTYFLVSSLSGQGKTKSKSRKVKRVKSTEEEDAELSPAEPEEPGIVSQIGSVLVAQASGLLLSIAREKLVEFLQSQVAKKDDTHERS